VISKGDLPMKVWSDCARCPKQNECDEIALIRDVDGKARTRIGPDA